jgi:hypothetical protein
MLSTGLMFDMGSAQREEAESAEEAEGERATGGGMLEEVPRQRLPRKN